MGLADAVAPNKHVRIRRRKLLRCDVEIDPLLAAAAVWPKSKVETVFGKRGLSMGDAM